ncbi:EVE domain containing protein [Elaphomyces granulatus]
MPPRKRKAGVVDDNNDNDNGQPSAKKPRKPAAAETATTFRPRREINKEPASVKASDSKLNRPESRLNRPKSKTALTGAKRGRPPKSAVARKAPAAEPTPKTKKPVGRPRKIQPEVQPEVQPEAVQKDEELDEEIDEPDDGRCYWLMKAEPESRFEKGVDVKFSIDDLEAAKEPEPWDGVRNAAARNNLRAMRKGDYAFFYHSNCKVPAIAGIMEIVREHSVDETAFDPAHPYYDPKSTREKPKWEVVHVKFRRKFKKVVTLDELKSHAKPGLALEKLQTLRQSRLSVSAVTPKQWKFITTQFAPGGDEQPESSTEQITVEDTHAANGTEQEQA